jgi:thiol-disulfide isomerase/thioredoxin
MTASSAAPAGSSSADDRPLLVGCLCAAWCRTCGDYRASFDALAAEFAAQARFVWVDIEDDEAALGDVDVMDFPTLLARGEDIASSARAAQPQAARQLLQRALARQLGRVQDASLAGLPQRIAALP